MCELKLFDYQREVVESNERETICNWSRGLGKDYTLVCKILNDRPNRVLWEGRFNDIVGSLEDALKLNDIVAEVAYADGCRNTIVVKFEDGSDVIIQRNFDGVCLHVDLLVFYDMLPYYIQNVVAKQTISMITTNNYNKSLQRLLPRIKINEQGVDTMLKNNLTTANTIKEEKETSNSYYNAIDILSVPKEISTRAQRSSRLEDVLKLYDNGTNDKFLMQTLARLQTEYDAIAPSKDNVLTRQNLLKMIMEVQRQFRI